MADGNAATWDDADMAAKKLNRLSSRQDSHELSGIEKLFDTISRQLSRHERSGEWRSEALREYAKIHQALSRCFQIFERANVASKNRSIAEAMNLELEVLLLRALARCRSAHMVRLNIGQAHAIAGSLEPNWFRVDTGSLVEFGILDHVAPVDLSPDLALARALQQKVANWRLDLEFEHELPLDDEFDDDIEDTGTRMRERLRSAAKAAGVAPMPKEYRSCSVTEKRRRRVALIRYIHSLVELGHGEFPNGQCLEHTVKDRKGHSYRVRCPFYSQTTFEPGAFSMVPKQVCAPVFEQLGTGRGRVRGKSKGERSKPRALADLIFAVWNERVATRTLESDIRMAR